MLKAPHEQAQRKEASMSACACLTYSRQMVMHVLMVADVIPQTDGGFPG